MHSMEAGVDVETMVDVEGMVDEEARTVDAARVAVARMATTRALGLSTRLMAPAISARAKATSTTVAALSTAPPSFRDPTLKGSRVRFKDLSGSLEELKE